MSYESLRFVPVSKSVSAFYFKSDKRIQSE